MFGDYLLRKGAIDKIQLQQALEEQKIGTKKIGETAMALRLLTPERVEVILANQKDGKKFGETAITIGLLTIDSLQFWIPRQKTGWGWGKFSSALMLLAGKILRHI